MTKARETKEATDKSLSTHNGFSLISNEKLLEIYATMLKCRMLEERIHALNRQSGRAASATIHIAAVAGATIDLQRGDMVAPSRGAWTPCFAKGMPLAAIFASAGVRGSTERISYASLGLISPKLSMGRQLERALKAAAICKSKRNKKVVAVFASDAAGAADELEEAIKHAGKKKLPVLFVCETKTEADDSVLRVKEYGVPGVAVEDDDAVAIYRVATEALTHARRGRGPTLIECGPWPFGDKGTSPRRHAKHPIKKMETYLAGKGLFNRRFKTRVMADFNRELDAAMKSVAR